MIDVKRATRTVPAWVPVDVRNYVFHTELGLPIRVLARAQACHASTIMRQIRKVEQRRDDPLVDGAIAQLAEQEHLAEAASPIELLQALRRLAVPDAILAIADGMDQGVILRDISMQDEDRVTNLSREIAQTLALRGWIATSPTTGRVLRYRITPAGRVALREMTAQTENRARAMAEGPASFDGAPSGVGTWEAKPHVTRAVSHDSPVMALARRKDRDGAPFLSRPMVRAAERLREDFEIAQLGRHRAGAQPPDWADVLRAIETDHPTQTGTTLPTASNNAAARHVHAALTFLGPGLSEVALRCCCLLEGLETTEKHLGWAARSGKVVLRIALQRLILHYGATGSFGPRIG